MENCRKKKISEYKAVVFDLDGTLYYQRTLRLVMACRLMGYYLCHPFQIKELLILKEFRSVREHWDELAKEEGLPLDAAQYQYVAEKMHTTPEAVEQTVQTWIYDNPLSALKKSRDEEIAELIRTLKNKGILVLLFSDYPVQDKLEALELLAETDGMYSASDERLMELKPSPKGLQLIMKDFGLEADELLMIGDRYSKDGASAINAGVDYLILGKTPASRRSVYKQFSQELQQKSTG